jgi:3-oxoacyl-[acyl-carrier-protein] synthase-1
MPRPSRIAPVAVTAHGLACAAGVGVDALAALLRAQGSALRPLASLADDAQEPQGAHGTPQLHGAWTPAAALTTSVGVVRAADHAVLPPHLAHWDCRANRIAALALAADGFDHAVAAARSRHGADRVALVLGTSASTIAVSEAAYRAPAADGGFPPAVRREALNTLHAVTAFVQEALAIAGPACTVSTACSSSAKAFAQAERWLRLGLADAVVVGGVDALSDSLLFGFNALGLLSPQPCRPFAAARDGISIGEAAGFVLLERDAPRAGGDAPAKAPLMRLLGHGESNDAHHMSSPHPEGLGAERALDAALARAGLEPAEVGYVNLHGTASARNDEVEAALVARRFAAAGCGYTRVGATKGATGHTMGAAGVLEALVCALALRRDDGFVPGTPGCDAVDPALGDAFAAMLQRKPAPGGVDIAVSHSFGFGGNNAVLVFGR